MTQHITHRSRPLLAIAATGAALVLLAGCSGGGSSDDDVTPASSFTLVAPTSGAGSTAQDLIAADYEAATGIHIDVTDVPADSYDSTVKTQLQGGSAADLITVTGGNLFPTSVGPLVDAGMLTPLEGDAYEASMTPQTQSLFEGADGTVYAQPTGTVVYGLITNDGTVTVTGRAFPADTSDLLASCAATNQAPAFNAVAGSTASSTAVVVAEVAANYVYAADPDWNQKRENGEVTFADSDGWKATFDALTEMVTANCFQPGAAGAGFTDLVGGLLGGATQTVALPSLLIAQLNAQAGATLPLSVQAWPATDDGDAKLIAQPGAGFGINAAADPSAQAAAQKFLDWLAEPENAAAFASYEGSIPVADLADAATIPTAYAAVATQLVAGDYTYLPSSDWTNPAVYSAMGDGLTAIMTGQGDTASALAAMDAAWDQ
ncbi:MAG: extracellular solute-binding protein [Microbacterium sp.]|uniref:ABC transporter substrate-binding protein n=1 Tax=Microbacterium sp. TaxID=51671 RepID=UPI0039E3069C